MKVIKKKNAPFVVNKQNDHYKGTNMDYEIVKKIIKERFSLGEEGYSNFVKNIEHNVPEYSFTNENKRKIYKIDPSLYHYVDDGFKILNGLSSFISEHNVTFSEYSANKIALKGNSIKIFKAASDFYLRRLKKSWERVGLREEVEGLHFIERVCSDTDCSFMEIFRLINKLYKPSEIKAFRETFNNLENKTLEEATSFLMLKIFEKIGCYKINIEKELYFVISTNFNDFFMCSSEEGWTSCLNPESSSGFWSALPFLAGDPNRCLCIISDLSEKEYLGVKSIRMFKRGWGELDRTGVICTGMFYPAKEYIDDTFYSLMSIEEKIRNISSISYSSRYPLSIFYNEYGVFDFLYQDDTCFDFSSEEIAFLRRGHKNHTIIVRGKGTRDYHMCSYKEGLKKLIEEGKTIGEFPGLRFCSQCHDMLDEEEKIIYNLVDGKEIISCKSCFMRLNSNTKIICSSCGAEVNKGVTKISKGRLGENKHRSVICNECHECAKCSSIIPRGEEKVFSGSIVCSRCKNELEESSIRRQKRNPTLVSDIGISSDLVCAIPKEYIEIASSKAQRKFNTPIKINCMLPEVNEIKKQHHQDDIEDDVVI